MAYKKRKSRGERIVGGFVPLPNFMIHKPAWRSLSGNAVRVFVELHSRFNGYNNGDLSLSLEEGARLLGIGKATMQRSLRELMEKGFIRMTDRGRWHGRKAATYALTMKQHGTQPPTNDWLLWAAPVAAPAAVVLRRTTKEADGTATEPQH
jgi:hypothetical protein